MHSDADLYESLDSALRSLGDETHNIVISAFELRRISFRPESVDVKAVDKVLFELFGLGSSAILVAASHRLNTKLILGFDESKLTNPVHKMLKWLEINGGEERAFA
jgi:hypothetical protein